MKLSDFRNLDRNNIGAWPQSVKFTLCAVLFLILVAAGWWFKIADQQDDLKQKQASEETLKKEFSEKQAKVVNLEALRQQLDEMRDMLRQLLRQLPSKTEMPELLVDISQTALSSGLEVQLFQPGPETIKEGFYAEKPITLRMLGTYHQFGTFISGVAALPRVVILTMHDVSLKPSDAKATAGAGQLTLEGTVKTYRYVEEDENDNAQKPAPGAPPAAPKGGK
ncbi:MAG TPA: type 4a pilus biogenesis protein PilO [Rudaea sp.]|nr:type 4a pilus biogenesis protein PilO [Rudaea sp.]